MRPEAGMPFSGFANVVYEPCAIAVGHVTARAAGRTRRLGERNLELAEHGVDLANDAVLVF